MSMYICGFLYIIFSRFYYHWFVLCLTKSTQYRTSLTCGYGIIMAYYIDDQWYWLHMPGARGVFQYI